MLAPGTSISRQLSLSLARALAPYFLSASPCCCLHTAQPVWPASEARQYEPHLASWALPTRHREVPAETVFGSQRVDSVLSHCRTHLPDMVWSKLAGMFPCRKQQPVAIDVVVSSEGRAGVELAKRGFRVLSICQSVALEAATLRCAVAHHAQLDLATAKVERDLVRPGTADLVTCMHGLHLLAPQQALREAHRILKPGSTLAVAWNDSDLSSNFVAELEQLLECREPALHRAARHHRAEDWTPALQQGGLFRLREYEEHPNTVALPCVATLQQLLAAQASLCGHMLMGPSHEAFLADVASLAERYFGKGPLLLPMQTKLFLLEKQLFNLAAAGGEAVLVLDHSESTK